MNPSASVTGFGPLNDGIQSAIDEAARSAARNVVPALSADLTHRMQVEIVPGLLNNTQMQANIGRAAGQAAFADARPYVLVGLGALLLIASVEVFRFVGKSARANPTENRTSCECSGEKSRRRRRGTR